MSNGTIIYMRHGEDQRDHHKYDEVLTDRGKKGARHLAERLINEYGVPDVIYCSPFYRTRQTCKQILKVIRYLTRQRIKVKIDPRLSRFFTEKQARNPDIRTDTMDKGPPIDETWEEFKERVEEQVDDMERKLDRYPLIWCIGHTLIIKRVAKIKNIEKDKFIEFCDTVILDDSY